MNDREHLRKASSKIPIVFEHLVVFEKLLGYGLESFLRPIVEPIQRTTVDQGWEVSTSDTELVTYGRHAQDDVEMESKLLDECLINSVLADGNLLLFHELGERS